MNDLLTKSFMSYVDLKKASMKDPDLDLESGPEPDLQMQPIQQPDHNLTAFLNEAELVKQEMNSIRETLTQLELANQDSKSLHNPESLKSNRRRINGDIVSVLKKAKGIKSRLEEMDRANAESRRLSGCKMGTPVDRTRTAVANGLRKKLKELMMDFQELRQRMMSEYKETVGRRYFTVTGEEANEEVIEKIINSGSDGQGGEEFMSRAIQEHGRGKVLETVVEIQDRHDAAKEIETSLLELHQVFLDMAVMVEAQGEKMDDIEHHVMNAAHYVNDGTKNLKTAKGYQKQSRKCMCFGIILLLIIILVIVIPILTSVTKS
ncbi:putative target SNARE coiled-coil domain, syntaxin domain, syntaxin/epimorphin [Helianthus annuus]|nr:putative target SNARE coiled-coil domain, syntaxin domain, syntaxin/epimorphin [Helianthus annuus]KAJ0954307.1 putative target SNARE coiled-coil domain, syntaxin domain, syntaxin/epimorphin [Helianthus annuus]